MALQRSDYVWIAVVVAFIVVSFVLERVFPGKITGKGSTDYGPVKVEYLFKGPLVPYESIPDIDGPLWAKVSQSKKLPKPKEVPATTTAPAQKFMTVMTRAETKENLGYAGGCELPKIDRSVTNTAFCMQCHEQPNVEGTPVVLPIRLETSHPVGVTFTPGTNGYVTTADPNLVMVDGKMECTTCHDYWAVPQQPHWVAVPPDICTKCHNK